jgi:hypothetical protein
LPAIPPGERASSITDAKKWLRGVDPAPATTIAPGLIAFQSHVPSAALTTFKVTTFFMYSFFICPSGSEEYTDGIKLPHLLPAVVLGTVPEGTPFGQTIGHIRMFFFDGG